MPHRTPMTFHEFSKPFMAASDGGRSVPYGSDTQREVSKALRAVDKAKARIRELQAGCSHDREVINLAPSRREFQCQDCGLIRGQQFGAYKRRSEPS